MDRTERFYRIDQLLHERRVVSLPVFLGMSRAKVHAAHLAGAQYNA